MLRDLSKRPQLVLIDVNPYRHAIGASNFDFLAFYKEDPQFRAEWNSYREIEQIGPYRQFVRVPDAAQK